MKPAGFSKTLYVGWGDLDANGHMRNTAYLDKAADVRMYYFAEHGFPSREFARVRIGPVLRKDEIEYFRELRLLDPVTVSLAVEALSPDGARFVLRNEFTRDGQLVARVTSTGGWLDLKARKLIAPPEALRVLLETAPRTNDFHEVPQPGHTDES
ncbi:MAG: acyl-CoA thioesterase [Gemmatimonadaceae bacterium]